MTGMSFPRKRSERGASLLMLVSIIGLAFVVTVAGFLVAASNSQNTARLASAKVDIATREDALMWEILQQTATGMLPSTDQWGHRPDPDLDPDHDQGCEQSGCYQLRGSGGACGARFGRSDPG